MKTPLTLLLVAFSVVAGWATTLPTAVVKAFQKNYPTATEISWEELENGFFEASFVSEDQEWRAYYTAEGHWKESQMEVTYEDLPQTIRINADTYLDKHHTVFLKSITAEGRTIYYMYYNQHHHVYQVTMESNKTTSVLNEIR